MVWVVSFEIEVVRGRGTYLVVYSKTSLYASVFKSWFCVVQLSHLQYKKEGCTPLSIYNPQ